MKRIIYLTILVLLMVAILCGCAQWINELLCSRGFPPFHTWIVVCYVAFSFMVMPVFRR